MFKRGKVIRWMVLILTVIGLTFFGKGISPAFAQNQEVTISPSNFNQARGDSFTVSVGYDVSDDNNTLTGLDLNIHFDSSKLNYISYDNFLDKGEIQISPILTNDTANEDNNPSTDKMIVMSWATTAFPAQWPNTALPVVLAELNFSVKQDAESGDTVINISVSGNAAGYGLDLSHGTVTILQDYNVTFTAGPGGSITGTTPQIVTQGGDCIEVSADADNCYEFVDWSDGSTANPRTVTNVTSDLNLTANFAQINYTVTFSAGEGGSLTGTANQPVACGDDCTEVSADADNCYEFVDWSDGSTQNPRTVNNVTTDLNLTANFAQTEYTTQSLLVLEKEAVLPARLTRQ